MASSKHVTEIDSLLSNFETRSEGLRKLVAAFESNRLTDSDVSQHALVWLRSIQSYLKDYASYAITKSCFYCLYRILISSSTSQDLYRHIRTEYLFYIVELGLSNMKVCSVPSLLVLRECLTRFNSSLFMFKKRITDEMMQYLHKDCNFAEHVCRVISLVPSLGSSGQNGALYGIAWAELLSTLMRSTHAALNAYRSNENSCKNEHLEVNGVVNYENSYGAYYANMLLCTHCLLTEETSYPVTVPVKDLLDFFIDASSLFFEDKSSLCDSIDSILFDRTLNLFKGIVHCASYNLCRYATFINQTLLKLLSLKTLPYKNRGDCYDAFCTWLNGCNHLTGLDIVHEELLKHIIRDVSSLHSEEEIFISYEPPAKKRFKACHKFCYPTTLSKINTLGKSITRFLGIFLEVYADTIPAASLQSVYSLVFNWLLDETNSLRPEFLYILQILIVKLNPSLSSPLEPAIHIFTNELQRGNTPFSLNIHALNLCGSLSMPRLPVTLTEQQSLIAAKVTQQDMQDESTNESIEDATDNRVSIEDDELEEEEFSENEEDSDDDTLRGEKLTSSTIATEVFDFEHDVSGDVLDLDGSDESYSSDSDSCMEAAKSPVAGLNSIPVNAESIVTKSINGHFGNNNGFKTAEANSNDEFDEAVIIEDSDYAEDDENGTRVIAKFDESGGSFLLCQAVNPGANLIMSQADEQLDGCDVERTGYRANAEKTFVNTDVTKELTILTPMEIVVSNREFSTMPVSFSDTVDTANWHDGVKICNGNDEKDFVSQVSDDVKEGSGDCTLTKENDEDIPLTASQEAKLSLEKIVNEFSDD